MHTLGNDRETTKTKNLIKEDNNKVSFSKPFVDGGYKTNTAKPILHPKNQI